MSTAILALVAVIIIILFRFLNVTSTPAIPKLYGKDANFIQAVYKACPTLFEK